MSSLAAREFLEKYGMSPERIAPARDAVAMCEAMERGLRGEPSPFPMIPTYLSDEGEIPLDRPCVVIDAGGTNFRRALVTFTAAANGTATKIIIPSEIQGLAGLATGVIEAAADKK